MSSTVKVEPADWAGVFKGQAATANIIIAAKVADLRRLVDLSMIVFSKLRLSIEPLIPLRRS